MTTWTEETRERFERWQREAPDNPWEAHELFMEMFYGGRFPTCCYCGKTVVMALQGFYSGGSFTTQLEAEGPLFGDPGGDLDLDGFACAESPPDREGHDAHHIEPAVEAAKDGAR